jgi:hypothetical protein
MTVSRRSYLLALLGGPFLVGVAWSALLIATHREYWDHHLVWLLPSVCAPLEAAVMCSRLTRPALIPLVAAAAAGCAFAGTVVAYFTKIAIGGT